MPLDQNPHQTVTHFGCVGFSMYACGFSCAKITMSFTWKDDFFFATIGIFCKSIAGPLSSVVQAYTQPYSFGGKIKLIFCQIRHELSVTIHETSTSWKKKLDGGPNTNQFTPIYIHYCSLQSFSQAYNQAFPISYVVGVLSISSSIYSLKSTANNRFLSKTFFYLSECPGSLVGSVLGY